MSDVTIAEMQAALNQLGVLKRSIEGAEKLVAGLAQSQNLGRELDAALEKKRAALAASIEHIEAEAKASAIEAAKSIVPAAHREAAAIVANAKAEGVKLAAAASERVAQINNEAARAQEHLDRLNAAIDDAKRRASAIHSI